MSEYKLRVLFMQYVRNMLEYAVHVCLLFRVLAELPQEVKFNIEGIDILIRAHLINVGRDFDPLLAQVSASFLWLYFIC